MQPTFLPWIGYFAMIDRVDEFVFLDSVQFAKRSWQQRNQIKTPNGAQWITMPVSSSGKRDQLIKDTVVSQEGNPGEKIISALKTNYSKAPFFKAHSEPFFSLLRSEKNLCELNIKVIETAMDILKMPAKPIFRSSEMPVSGARADLLVSISRHLGASRYLSAPGSREYIEESNAFEQAGIDVAYHEYKHPEYRQLFGAFQPYMTVLDLIFNEGERAYEILR